VLVGETNILAVDIDASSTTLILKYNNLAANDIVYMEAAGKVEFMKIISGPTGSTGIYSYTVQRNYDGSGADAWYAGDAVFNTGTTGEGFIDLYSLRGIKTSSQAGPTIVGNVRNSLTFNDWTEHWALGNLKGLYGYTGNAYGIGLGKYTYESSFLTYDPTNGLRLINKYDDGTEVDVIKLAQDGSGHVGSTAIVWDGYQNVKVAGFNVDSVKFYGSSTIDSAAVFVGIQKISAANTKCFYAGATDSVGANAKFYVQGDGRIVSKDADGNTLFDSVNVFLDSKNMGRVFYANNSVVSTTATSATTILTGSLFLLPNETTVQAVFRAWVEGTSNVEVQVQMRLTPILTNPANNAAIGNYSASSLNSSIQGVGDGNSSCFNPGTTYITMADGTKRLLKYIKPGDKVISYNEEKRIFEVSTVGTIRKARTRKIFRISRPNDRRETLVTGEHPFFTTKGWMELKYITSEKVLTAEKIFTPIYKSEIQCDLEVWTLSMSKGNKNFIANGFVAHNKGTSNAYAQFGVCKIDSSLTSLLLYKWELRGYAPSGCTLKVDNICITTGRSPFSQTEVRTGY